MRSPGELARTAAAGLAALGLLTTTVANVSAVVELRETHFWILLAVSYTLLLPAIWPPRPESRRAGFGHAPVPASRLSVISRYRWVMGATAVFMIAGGWHFYRIRTPEPLPSGEEIVPRDEPVVGMRGGHALARASFLPWAGAAVPPRVLSVELSPRKTSYVVEVDEDGERMFKLHGRFARSRDGRWRMRADPEEAEREIEEFRWSGCAPYRTDPRPVEAMRRFVRAKGRTGALQYLTSPGSPERLARQRAAVLRQILPRGVEWAEIQPASDREAILGWLRECVGLVQPVLALTLSNPDPSPVAITAVRYLFFGAAVECGGAPDTDGLILPTVIYAHDLQLDHQSARTIRYPVQTPAARAFLSEWERSGYNASRRTSLIPPPRRHPLSPGFRIGARQEGAFELHLYSSRAAKLWPVLLAIELETSNGNVRTPEFWMEFPLDGTC